MPLFSLLPPRLIRVLPGQALMFLFLLLLEFLPLLALLLFQLLLLLHISRILITGTGAASPFHWREIVGMNHIPSATLGRGARVSIGRAAAALRSRLASSSLRMRGRMIVRRSGGACWDAFAAAVLSGPGR